MRTTILFSIIFFFSLISCKNDIQGDTNKITDSLSENFKDIDLNLFKNWEINRRKDSLVIFDYKLHSDYFGFLIRYSDGEFYIKNKTNSSSQKFITFSEFSESELFKHQLSKKKIKKVVTEFKKTGAISIIYLNSFNGILIKCDDVTLMYLFSDLEKELPLNYKKIKNHWYTLN